MVVLSERDKRVLEYIKAFVSENGYPPAVREIGAQLSIKSTATVYFSIHRLEDAGYLKQSSNKRRSIELLGTYPGIRKKNTSEIPLVGKITAGQPITAIENIEDVYNIPQDLFGSGDMFMLHVEGNSMINAGIHSGDKVIIRKQETAVNGEIVAAMVNGEATIKRFYKEKGKFRLQPENDTFSPLIVDNVDIIGIVTGLIRRIK